VNRPVGVERLMPAGRSGELVDQVRDSDAFDHLRGSKGPRASVSPSNIRTLCHPLGRQRRCCHRAVRTHSRAAKSKELRATSKELRPMYPRSDRVDSEASGSPAARDTVEES